MAQSFWSTVYFAVSFKSQAVGSFETWFLAFYSRLSRYADHAFVVINYTPFYSGVGYGVVGYYSRLRPKVERKLYTIYRMTAVPVFILGRAVD